MIAPCGSPFGYKTGTLSPAGNSISSAAFAACTITSSPSGNRNRNRGAYTTPPSFANAGTFSVIVATARTLARANIHECTANPAAIPSKITPNGGNHVAIGGATNSNSFATSAKTPLAHSSPSLFLTKSSSPPARFAAKIEPTPMPISPTLLKFARQIHLYTGLFIAPAILFFALSGALQTFNLHEASRTSDYKPPTWIVHLSRIHKDQTFTIPVRKPRPADAAPSPTSTSTTSPPHPRLPSRRKSPTCPSRSSFSS